MSFLDLRPLAVRLMRRRDLGSSSSLRGKKTERGTWKCHAKLSICRWVSLENSWKTHGFVHSKGEKQWRFSIDFVFVHPMIEEEIPGEMRWWQYNSWWARWFFCKERE